MDVEIREVGTEVLAHYADIPIRFRVESVLEVEQVDGGIGGLRMVERPDAATFAVLRALVSVKEYLPKGVQP